MVNNEKHEEIESKEETQLDPSNHEETKEELQNETEEINDEVNNVEPEDEIEQLKAQLQEEENKYLRILADYDNFKRRASLDKEALQKYRAQSLLTNLIPVIDNFARAISVEAKTEEARSMMEGMDMIYRSFMQALETEGLIEIEAVDKEFDPNFHQAIMTGNDSDKESGIVLEEMQKGYILKDRVLRPSMVKVNE